MKKPAEVAYARGPMSQMTAQMDHEMMHTITDEERRLGLMPEGIRKPGIYYMTAQTGQSMEIAANMLVDAKNVLSESISETRDKYAQLIDLSKDVNDGLIAHIQALRSSRMACTAEIAQSISALKDVRKFFLDSDHETEMKRLERFISVCKELKAMKEDGTLDAIADTSLRLMSQKG